MKWKLYILNDILLLFLVLYSFVFGGFLQFFIGVSPTITSFLICGILLGFFIVKRKHKVNKNNLLFAAIIFVLIIYTFSLSIINNLEIVQPAIYSLFFIIPFSIYSLFNNRGKYKLYSINQLKQFLLLLAILQLPILIFQYYGYGFLMQFNNSGQLVRDVDFQFGSFFLKNDHALGYFLIANILYVWTYPVIKNLWQQISITIVLVISLLLANSKVSAYLGVLAFVYLLIKHKKYLLALLSKSKFVIFLIIVLLIGLVVYFEPRFYVVLKGKFNYVDALKWYQLGLARREQIILIIVFDGILYFGNGAYSYFDIIKGDFNKTFKHFSQYIWFYYDLGVVGLSLVLAFFYRMHKLFEQNKSSFSNFMIFGLILYSYFTIVTFDVSFVLIYFLYNYSDDEKHSVHSIS